MKLSAVWVELLKELRGDAAFMENVTAWPVKPTRMGDFAPLPEDINPKLRNALEKRGITRLYSHQAP